MVKKFYEHMSDSEENIFMKMLTFIKEEFDNYIEEEDYDVSDPDDYLYELESYIYDTYSIRVLDSGLLEFDRLTPMVRKLIGINPVILYHYTSSILLPSIREKGFIAGFHKTNPHANSYAGVYLTTEVTGKAIDGYKLHAYNKHGGETIRIAIKCYLSELRLDPDDAELASVGDKQFIMNSIPADRIIDIEVVY